MIPAPNLEKGYNRQLRMDRGTFGNRLTRLGLPIPGMSPSPILPGGVQPLPMPTIPTPEPPIVPQMPAQFQPPGQKPMPGPGPMMPAPVGLQADPQKLLAMIQMLLSGGRL